MTPQRSTLIFIAIATTIILTYDAWVALKYGQEATISGVLYDLARRFPSVAFIFGYIAGHIFR